MPLKLLVILVVFSTVLGSRQPALAVPTPAPVAARTGWVERLTVGLSNPITRAALLQRVAFAPPAAARLTVIVTVAAPPRRPLLSRPQLCLPPPQV